MPKYFPGVTHAIVKTSTNAKLTEGGLLAMVYLCFLEDADVIVVQINKMTGPITGATAELPGFSIPYNGKTISVAGLRGKPADEAKLMALVAFDKVKQKFGLKFNKQYKVVAKDITEIGGTDAQHVSGVGTEAQQ